MLKCLGSIEASDATMTSTVVTVSLRPKGVPFKKSASVSLCRCLFCSTSGPHPPPRRRPQTQIDFEDRKLYDVGNDCLMTIDGTDFRVPQTGEAKTGNAFASHKYAGKSALRYEIGG